MDYFLAFLNMIVSLVLIGVILLQRGRGGGLVASLSGLGGQSAFGTKAGDVFTRITIVIAFVWVMINGIQGQVLRAKSAKFKNDTGITEMESRSKDTDAEASKAAESKKNADAATSKDSPAKDADSKSDSKQPAESSKELTPDDVKKSDAAPKSPEPPKKELNESSDEKSDEKKSDEKK